MLCRKLLLSSSTAKTFSSTMASWGTSTSLLTSLTRSSIRRFNAKMASSLTSPSTSVRMSSSSKTSPSLSTVPPLTSPSARRSPSSSKMASLELSSSSYRMSSSLPGNLQELEQILSTDRDRVDPELWKKSIAIEYEYLRYEGALVPSFMTDEMWRRVYADNNKISRLSLYRLFHIKEGHKAKAKAKSETRARARREREVAPSRDSSSSANDVVESPHPGFLRRIDVSTMKHVHQFHLPYASDFGQPIVFDLGVDYAMKPGEASSFVSQMRDIYSFNRAQWEPFQLHLCNYDPARPGMRELVEGEQSRGFCWNVTDRCFSEIFPDRERLVYLSPDAPEVATDWRHDDVYIVGGVVDKIDSGGRMTLSKIKELGIRSRRFNIDGFFKKKQAPSLTLDVVFAGLIDARDTDGNWIYASRHYPKRMVEWRPEFSFMEKVDGINVRNDQKICRIHRNILKPRKTQYPYRKVEEAAAARDRVVES